jgi:beta-glucosidase/6-phospho-beta-glucosidase/beta-galactosidase
VSFPEGFLWGAAGCQVAHRLLLSHGLAVQLLRAGGGGRIGIARNPQKFGIVEVEPGTLRRIPRAGATWSSSVARSNGLPAD